MIDSHCHLAGDEYEADLGAVVDRARQAGVRGALVILAAGDPAEGDRAGRVKGAWSEVKFSVGIHPHHAAEHAGDLDAALRALDAAVTAHRAVAIGEIGLDYHYDFSPRDVQQEVFRRQIRFARDRRLPIVIHTREAADDTFRILAEEASGIPTVFHCFTGGPDMARKVLDIGAYLSFAGIVTFPKALEVREVARTVPADRFLVETDSPYLAPVPYRGRRNEPAFVARVVEVVAALRGELPDRVAEQTTGNFEAVFRLADRRGDVPGRGDRPGENVSNLRHDNGLAR